MRSTSGVISLSPVSLLVPPLCVTAIMWLTSPIAVTTYEVLCALFLLLLPWVSFLVWRQQEVRGLPVFAMVGFAYWWYFAIGLFWLERVLWVGRGYIAPESVTGAMWLALVGVLCIGLGMKVPVAVLQDSRQLELSDHPTTWPYVRLLLIAGTLGSLASGSTKLLGTNGRNVVEILISTVPTVALMLLLRRCLEDKDAKLDRLLLAIYFPLRIVAGLASGWLGSVVSLGLMCGALYMLIRRKVPWTMIAVCAVAVVFLQVGKKEFRNQYWNERAEGGIIEKATSWLNRSSSKWSEASDSGGGESAGQLSSQSLERTSLLPQVAHVLDLTPSQVPFQMGQTYSYLATTLIPRFLWPDKPSVNDANRFYQVTFGLTSIKDVDSVNIGVGCLAEAYINFGWSGVLGIMFAIGVLLGIYERSFVAGDSSTLFLAIGLALLPGIVGIESQMAAYVGGVVQTVLLTLLVFLPIVRRRSGIAVGPAMAPATARLCIQPQQ